MNRKGRLFSIFCCLAVVSIFFANLIIVSAQNVSEQNISEDVFSDIGDVELQETSGISPDSFLYFLDSFLEKVLVGNDPEKALRYREEKIAEAKEMIEAGNIEGAKKALEIAEFYSKILEKEVSPEIEKRARESSKAVQEVLSSLEENLQGEEWSDVKKIIELHMQQEEKIAVAAKISSRIKELCETLAELDPVEYAKVCYVSDDSSNFEEVPEWKRKLDKKLTEKQRKEAKEFFDIILECFETSGEKCRCEDVKIPKFSERCSIMAKLASECELQGNNGACEKMDALEEEEPIVEMLPPHLQEVFFEVEDRYFDERYDMRLPEECVEQEAFDRKSCAKVMFMANAPEECVKAMEEGLIDFENEREARKQCEEIMFELNAPEECIEAGIKDPKECGKFMFKLHAPEECLEAGLTGESRGDEKKCRELIEKKGRGKFDHRPPALGVKCLEIDNPEERLKCYDSALRGLLENAREGRVREDFGIDEKDVEGVPPGGWPEPCIKHGTLTRESCEETMRAIAEGKIREEFKEIEKDLEDFEEHPVSEDVENVTEKTEPAKEVSEGIEKTESSEDSIQEEHPESETTSESSTSSESSGSSESESSTESSTSEQTSETASSTESESTSNDAAMSEISFDNRFLEYYYI